MDVETFQEFVAETLTGLPEMFLDALDNVEIVVEDWPDRETMRSAHVRSPYDLLGFYHGVPLTERTSSYGLVMPDKISIYRRPIEAQSRSEPEIRATVHRVVLHEIAHYFGIDDDRLMELGAY